MQPLYVLAIVLLQSSLVLGHGRMMDPPQRSSMWRFNFSTPANYNDNELFCGGVSAQYNSVNQGRCGECGDEWSLPRPRLNDEGGLYGTGVIAKTYAAGQVITVSIQLTASHKGYFEFRLCPKSSATQLVTQDCLDRNLLQLEDGSTQFMVPTFDAGYYYPRVKLPQSITCENCVLQWYYKAANSWGDCGNGTWSVGCGNQETFVNCADIAIE